MSLTQRQSAAIVSAAARLSNLVGSCPEGHRPRDVSCPFCADELAYDALLAAFPNVVKRERQPEGEMVTVSDLRRERPCAQKGCGRPMSEHEYGAFCP